MNLEFRIFHLQEKQFGKRADLDDHRIDFEFNGGYVDLSFAIKHPEYYVVQQWTGLLDNKDNKIFDGDIVKQTQKRAPDKYPDYILGDKESSTIRKISWGQYSDDEYVGNLECWIFGKYEPISELIARTHDKYPSMIRTYEVIGNILENPDILNESPTD